MKLKQIIVWLLCIGEIDDKKHAHFPYELKALEK